MGICFCGKWGDGSINYDLDSCIELNLWEDEKEKVEYIMLVDFVCNDVVKVSCSGMCYVKDLLKVDCYFYVMYLVLWVVG